MCFAPRWTDPVTGFATRLHRRVAAAGSRICLGLDPRPELLEHTHPQRHGGSRERVAAAVAEHLLALVEATHDLVACCKPQAAFFEALGPAGLAAMAQVVERAKELDLPVIVDAKRGDIGSTAAAYAEAFLSDGGPFSGDAMTVNPFLGLDSLEPFVRAAAGSGRGLFVLLKTSNAGSRDLQELVLASGEPLFLSLARKLAEAARELPVDDEGYGPLGAVVGATNPAEQIRELRSAWPSAVFLLPGYGAQGATAADVVDAFDTAGRGAVVSASRSLDYPGGGGLSLNESVRASRAAALEMRRHIEEALDSR